MPEIPGRDEQILMAIINGTEYDKIPQSRIEYLLLQLKALIEGGLGVSDYTELDNKPSINNVTLIGNKSLSDLGIVNPMMLMGRVDSYADLANIQNPQTGWVYLVGLTTDQNLEEYVYTATNRWEFIGYNTITIDSAMSDTSENPVQNRVVTAALAGKQPTITLDQKPTASSTNFVNSGGIYSALAPISESTYESLPSYDLPVYFIYDD